MASSVSSVFSSLNQHMLEPQHLVEGSLTSAGKILSLVRLVALVPFSASKNSSSGI